MIEAHNAQAYGANLQNKGQTKDIFAKGEPDKGCTFSFILKNALVETVKL